MRNLHFCRDSVLRTYVGYYDRDAERHIGRKVPMLALEMEDPHGFLKSLTSCITLEDGLTASELFANLKPWQKEMTGIACMDFPAFVAESELAPTTDEDLASIDIVYDAEIAAKPSYKRDFFDRLEETENGSFVLDMGDEQITDILTIDTGWHSHGTLKAPKRDEAADIEYSTCSVDYLPLTDWCHLPLKIVSESTLNDQTPFYRRFLSSGKSVTDHRHPLARVEYGMSGEASLVRFPLLAPSPTFMSALVLGFFWQVGFHYSPVTRDRTLDSLRTQIAGLDGDKSAAEAFEEIYEREHREEQEYKRKFLERVLGHADRKGLTSRE